MIRNLRLLLLIFLLLSIPITTDALSPNEIYTKALKSVVHIDTLDKDGTLGSGTGFLAVAPDLVVTSWHIVKDARMVKITFGDGKKVLSPGWIARSLQQDVAFVRASTNKRPRLKLNYKTPQIGSKVYTLGAPNGWQFTFLDGIVSQYRRMNNINYTQVSCLCTYGSSGSPLLNSNGDVIGMIDSIDDEAPGITFAIETYILKKLYPHTLTKRW